MKTTVKKMTKRRGQLTRGLVLLLIVLMLMGTISTASAAGLLVADGGFGGVLEIESHDVTVTVNNGIAVTEVTQEFRNTEDRIVEALYTFPVPKGASVANFSMWINGKEMIGEVVEKKRARQIYESYKQTKRDPGLLEQKDFKTFEMRIFPIAARAKQTVKIRYYQQLECDNDWVTYVYPLSTVTHDNKASRTTGKFAFTLHTLSQIPIVEMQSPSHNSDFIFAKHTPKYRQASLETKGGDLNRDIVLAYRIERPATGVDILFSKDGGDDGYFNLTMTAGKELADKNGPMDYVVLLDISGSMADESKLKISRNCIKEFVSQLDDKDRFELMTFNVSPNPLFNSLQEADAESKKIAMDYLDSTKARGGTVLLSAMQTAYKYRTPDRPLNIVVFSDGMTEQSERASLLQAISQRPSNAKFFCVGVGNEVNRDLLSNMAEDAGGLAAFLSRGDDFERQARAFRRKLIRPVINNLKITVDGVGSYDIEPGKLPNLFHGTPVQMFGRYSKPGTGSVTIEGEINGSEFKKTVNVEFPKTDANNPEIQRMWAWKKVQRLMRQIDMTGRRDGLAEEIVRLGEGYSIVTEYTSFIVLENDAEYKRWKIKRRNTLLIEKDRQARQRLMGELETLRGKALTDLGPQKNELAMNTNPQTTTRTQQASPTVRTQSKRSNRGRGFDIFPTPSLPGGGPVGPIGLTIIGGLVVSGLASRKKRK